MTFPLLAALAVSLLGNVPAVLLPQEAGGRSGFIDGNGDWVIEPTWLYAGRFVEGRALVQSASGYGFLDAHGALAVAAIYDDASPFSGGLAAVKRNNLWGYVAPDGREAVAPRFESVGPWQEDRAAVRVHGKWGFLDRSGQLVVPAAFTSVGDFSEGLAAAMEGGRAGFIDAQGRWGVAPTLDEVRDGFAGGLAPARSGTTWGYVRSDGTWGIEPSFEEAWGFQGGLARVRVDGKWGFITPAGKLAIAAQWGESKPFYGGRAAVRREALWGFVDTHGTVVVEPRLEDVIAGFVEPLAWVKENGRWTWMDAQGRVVFDHAAYGRRAVAIHLALLVFSVVLARLLAGWLVRRHRARPDAVGRFMPLPPRHGGTTRWRLLRTRARVLAHCQRHPSNVDAVAVAAALQESADLVGSLLDALSAETGGRVRVYSSGRVLHDLDPARLARLRRGTALRAVGRVATFPLLLLIEVGAAWPLLVVGGILGLLVWWLVRQADSSWALFPIFSVAFFLCFLAAWPLAWLLRLVLSPWGRWPRRPATAAGLRVFHSAALQRLPSWVAVPLALVAGVVLIPVDWLLQLRDALHETLPPDDTRSPPHPLVPAAGRALTILRALRPWLAQPRPSSPVLAGRLLARAASQGGRLTSLDLLLHESLAPGEAEALGANLALSLAGNVDATAEGDLVFTFPPSALPPPSTDAASTELLRKDGVPMAAWPSNIPGLPFHQWVAASVMAACSFWWMVLFQTNQASELERFDAGTAWTFAALHLANAGACALTALCAFALRTAAASGVLRDCRRIACRTVLDALAGGRALLNASIVERQLVDAVHAVWPAFPAVDIRAVVNGAFVDVGARVSGERVDLADVQRRLHGVEQHARPQEGAAERLVYDTARPVPG